MKHLKILMFMVALASLGRALLPEAKAGEWSKKTTMTFNKPVELPDIVLPAGTYVFMLAPSSSDRNIVQVFNKDEAHIYATIQAIPDYRVRPTANTVVTFLKRPASSSEAIKAWFYPGDDYGEEFIYPKTMSCGTGKDQNAALLSQPKSR